MAGEQTYALIVAEGANTLTCVERSNRKLMLVLLALWTLLVAAIIPEGAVDVLPAQDGHEQRQAASLSTHHDKLLADAAAAHLDELGKLAHDPAHCQTHHEAPPPRELGLLEPEDTEEDGRLDALTVSFAVFTARSLPCVDQTLSHSATAWQAQFLAASALPRGPPSFRC
jgi:hypothetical protein